MPGRAAVRSYPVDDRSALLRIWPGDPDKADPDMIIRIDHSDDPQWRINRGPPLVMAIDCDYRHMSDNLLDLSQVSFLHAISFGGEDCLDLPVATRVKGSTVTTSRWFKDCVVAPFFRPYLKFEGYADRLQHYELQLRICAVVKDFIAPADSGAPEGEMPDDVFLLDSYNFLRPASENCILYFWFQVRNFDADRRATSDRLTRDLIEAFSEDLVVPKAVHRGLQEAAAPSINLEIDAANRQACGILERLIRKEERERKNS